MSLNVEKAEFGGGPCTVYGLQSTSLLFAATSAGSKHVPKDQWTKHATDKLSKENKYSAS